MDDDEIRPFPLFKGATRLPTKLGVPTTPLLVAVCTVAIITHRKAFWLGSMGLGLGGVALFAAAYLL